MHNDLARRMLDFSSSLYLGLRHASRSLAPWDRLTNGMPSALAEPPGAAAVAAALAALIGGERAVLVPSTLHLFWDLFGIRAGDAIAVYVNAAHYPIAWWGIERAAARGVAVRPFNHHDAGALRRLIDHDARRGIRPLVVADGFCPRCGRPAPVSDYLDEARRLGGSLLIDDTQALGIFGHSPGPGAALWPRRRWDLAATGHLGTRRLDRRLAGQSLRHAGGRPVGRRGRGPSLPDAERDPRALQPAVRGRRPRSRRSPGREP